LRDTEAYIFSRQSALRWWCGCQPYASASFTHRNIPGTYFCYRLSRPQGHSAAGRIRSIKKANGLIRNRTRDLPAGSIVPQPTTLQRVLLIFKLNYIIYLRQETIILFQCKENIIETWIRRRGE
jgi:hypothetical protein